MGRDALTCLQPRTKRRQGHLGGRKMINRPFNFSLISIYGWDCLKVGEQRGLFTDMPIESNTRVSWWFLKAFTVGGHKGKPPPTPGD